MSQAQENFNEISHPTEISPVAQKMTEKAGNAFDTWILYGGYWHHVVSNLRLVQEFGYAIYINRQSAFPGFRQAH